MYVHVYINKKPLFLPADGSNKACLLERINWKTIPDTGWMSLLHKNSWK